MMTSSNGNKFRVTGHLCGEFTGHRWISAQRPMTRSFDVFFDLRLNKRLSKQSWGWWFETLSCSLWRHCNVVWFKYFMLPFPIYTIVITSNHNEVQANKKNPQKLDITGLLLGNPPVNDGFYSQKAINSENISMTWRCYDIETNEHTSHSNGIKWSTSHESKVCEYLC